MALPLPGGEVLGYGFNVFGAYDASSRISPMFDIRYDSAKEWQQGTATYLLPLNVSFNPASKNYGNAYGFSSREAVQQHFAAKVDISGKFCFFSGEFSLDYSQDMRSDRDFSYGLVECFSQYWTLDMRDTSANALADWVKNDPDFKNLPEVYTAENRHLFFRFFDKFGIYYVTGVTVGSRLFYTCSVHKEHNYSERQIAAKLKMEYNAVFMKAGAEASAEWKDVGEAWSDQRQTHISTLGGDNGILAALAPGFPDNFHDAYVNWLASAQRVPAVIDFRVASIANLFSSDQAQAVKQALVEYIGTRLYVESETGGCLIAYNGRPVLPQGGGKGVNGFQLAAIDRVSLEIEFAKSYSMRGLGHDHAETYQRAYDDTSVFHCDKYIIVFTTWSMFGRQLPPAPFYDLLVQCGAGQGLSGWKNLHDLPLENPHWYSSDIAHCNYALVGIPGSGKGTAFESFERACSLDTGDGHWSYTQDWYDLPAPACSLEVDAYQLEDTVLCQLCFSRPQDPVQRETDGGDGDGALYVVPRSEA